MVPYMKSHKLPKDHPISPEHVSAFVDELFSADLHAKRVQSLADGALGIVHAGAIGIHAIGRGLAAAKGLTDKHAIKQVDRCVGNEKIDVEGLAPSWVQFCLDGMGELVVNLDWTEFDADDHSMLVLSLQRPDSGRAQPLLWKTVVKSELKNQRNDHEDELLSRFREIVPETVHVTVVADRGFADQKLFRFLEEELGFAYVIRFRSIVHLTAADGTRRSAKEWLSKSGRRTKTFRDVQLTAGRCPVATVVLTHEPGMADPWCLAISDGTMTSGQAKRLYGKRFTCEETFRDFKDLRFGLGMKWNRVTRTDRRDRLMLLATLAQALLTLLGEAGERAGLDRLLKANTSKRRTLSLFRQGLRWYELIPTMPEARLAALIAAFEEVLRETPPLGWVLTGAGK